MASKRCLPTRFFKDPDILNLASRDIQLILVGLVLLADDEGRELAHARLLSRELDYPPEQIEAALVDLAANDLIILYQVGKHRYYSLTRWGQWQSISSTKMTPSKYPAPPIQQHETRPDETRESVSLPPQHVPASPREMLGNSADSQHFPSQSNISESNSGEGEAFQSPPNVLTFPANRRGAITSTSDRYKSSDHDHAAQTQYTVQEVAGILHLPPDDALRRIVQDYQHDPLIHLLGEADSAREYITDPQRNSKGQRMSPAFFRRWLKREHEDAQLRQSYRHTTAATGMRGDAAPSVPTGAAPSLLSKSLMHLADEIPPGYLSYAKGG